MLFTKAWIKAREVTERAASKAVMPLVSGWATLTLGCPSQAQDMSCGAPKLMTIPIIIPLESKSILDYSEEGKIKHTVKKVSLGEVVVGSSIAIFFFQQNKICVGPVANNPLEIIHYDQAHSCMHMGAKDNPHQSIKYNIEFRAPAPYGRYDYEIKRDMLTRAFMTGRLKFCDKSTLT